MDLMDMMGITNTESTANKVSEADKEKDTRRKIIYLDDCKVSLLSAQSRLKEMYEIYPAQTEEMLFRLLKNVTPDVILLDLNMPASSGFNVFTDLRSKKEYADIPVIFLTGERDEKKIFEGLKAGVDDIILKPYKDKDIYEAIECLFCPERRAQTKPIVLAVDDEPSILQAINAVLNKDYTVYTLPGVANEKMLLELLKSIKPDIFILDLHMPGLSGVEVAEIVHGHALYAHMPIIFLTADAQKEAMLDAVSHGACDYVLKPIDKKILGEKMEKHLKYFLTKRRLRALAG